MKHIVVAILLLLSCAVASADQWAAEVDQNGVVLRVIVADQAFINTGHVGDPSRWIIWKGEAAQKNSPARGYTYDKAKDRFIPPKPFPSWTLDEQTARWKAPKANPAPKAGRSPYWDEATKDWGERPAATGGTR